MTVIPNLPQEKINALERILGGTKRCWFNPYQLLEIVNAYEIYDNKASRASKEIPRSVSTILRYWRRAGFKIHERGKGVDLKKYNQIKELIERGLGQTEIASEFRVTRQAISSYLKHHPELKEMYLLRKKSKKYEGNKSVSQVSQ